ncbi:MAG TPA: trehalose-phosphatase [Candidatus Polarisedimenticolia bacterium]|nr:trehalose-phosphatase [Candidatus Polarisedimenticolia bacterium]
MFCMASQNCALFLDVDGTLLDIAPTPATVRVPANLTRSLDAVAASLDGALALVSGRLIDDLDRLFRPLRLPSAGLHGAEIRRSARGDIEYLDCAPIAPALREAINGIVEAHRGVRLEDKGHALALHYRARPAAGPLLGQALRRLIAECGEGLSLLQGKMVLEVRDLRHSKASAVSAFMAVQPFAGRRPIFLGDDRTDEDGFTAVENKGGLALPVGRTHDSLREPAFASPSEVRDWLQELPDRLRAGL